MDILLLIFVFFFGTCVGSFLGVITDRLPRGESIAKGRSHCESCKKTLQFFDLIPLFSFLFLHGKCRYCQNKLSFYYPLIELVTGILFVTVILFSWYSIESVYALFIVSILVALFFIDLKYGILPFSLILAASIATLIHIFLVTPHLMFNFLAAALGACLLFLGLFLGTRGRGMGFGDVVYVIFMGLLLGFPKIVIGLYIAFISGAIISLLLIWLKRKKMKGGTIPFGPFLVLGTLISWLWGEQIVAKIMLYLVIQ